MYVDPDGEFIMLAAIAGFTIGMMGTAAHADKHGINMTGGDLFMAGVRWGALAAGGAGIAGAGATATAAKTATTAATKTKVGTFLAKPLMKAGLKSGTINTLSNYNYENGWSDLGLGTLADFGAGFAGGATAVGAGSKLAGMFVGGLLNTAVNTEYGDGGYEHAQAFVGGALSVYAGTGKLLKGKKLASKPFWKGAETFGKYGIQGTAYDFSYTDEKYFTKRTGWEHAGLFAMAGLSGVGAERYFTGGLDKLGTSQRIGIGAGIYAAELSVTSLIKQRTYARVNGYPYGGFYTGNSSRAKGWLLFDKWRTSSRGILLAQ
jgi:hypothetical protein